MLVPAASITPPKALPSENATLRTTLLELIALDVSLSGGDGQDLLRAWRMGSRREHGESDEDNNGAATQEDEHDDPFA